MGIENETMGMNNIEKISISREKPDEMTSREPNTQTVLYVYVLWLIYSMLGNAYGNQSARHRTEVVLPINTSGDCSIMLTHAPSQHRSHLE